MGNRQFFDSLFISLDLIGFIPKGKYTLKLPSEDDEYIILEKKRADRGQ